MGRKDGKEDLEPPDRQVARFLRADPELLAEVHAHAARIVRFKGYYIPESERLEVVQEVMVQVWHALAVRKVAIRESLLAMTETIACRRCVDWMRRHRDTEPIDEATGGAARGPDAALLEKERRDLGRRVLAELPAACRELIGQVLDEGRPYAAIAKATGRSEHALRTKMWQCLKEAREILGRMTDDPRRSDERDR